MALTEINCRYAFAFFSTLFYCSWWWESAGIPQSKPFKHSQKKRLRKWLQILRYNKAATTLKAGITQSFLELQMNKPFIFIVIAFIWKFIVFISIVGLLFIKTIPIVPSLKKEVYIGLDEEKNKIYILKLSEHHNKWMPPSSTASFELKKQFRVLSCLSDRPAWMRN